MPFQSHLNKPNGKGSHNRLQGTASTMLNQTKEAAAALGQQAEETVHSVGSRLKDWAQNVRSQGPNEGVMGSATSSLANTMECSGEYLQRKTLKGAADDVTDLIRKNPLPAILVGLGLGYLLAQTTRRS